MDEQLEIKHSRIVQLVILIPVLGLMSIMVWAFYFKVDPLMKDDTGIIVCAIIGILGSIVLYFNLKMLIQNPAIITINKDGFEYNPGGVSSGWIQWSNVEEIKYVDVKTERRNSQGVNLETALAVKLKDNTIYLNQYNIVIKGLMKINQGMYDADILFSLSSFGKRCDDVVALMDKNWASSKKRSH